LNGKGRDLGFPNQPQIFPSRTKPSQIPAKEIKGIGFVFRHSVANSLIKSGGFRPRPNAPQARLPENLD
jgi:hypothetical protein